MNTYVSYGISQSKTFVDFNVLYFAEAVYYSFCLLRMHCLQNEIIVDLCPTPFSNMRDYLRLGREAAAQFERYFLWMLFLSNYRLNNSKEVCGQWVSLQCWPLTNKSCPSWLLSVHSSEPVFVDHLRSPGIDSRTGGPVRQPYFSYRPAEPHRRRNRFLCSINDYKYGLWSCS
jgi:hypothetical protein